MAEQHRLLDTERQPKTKVRWKMKMVGEPCLLPCGKYLCSGSRWEDKAWGLHRYMKERKVLIDPKYLQETVRKRSLHYWIIHHFRCG